MFEIQNLTNDPKQRQTLVLPDGTLISISIAFVPLQTGWFITNITYQTFALNGVRISNNPNLLYQYRNQIPFGLACFSLLAAREPSQQDDFASGASKLFILTAEEVVLYGDYLSGQI